MKPRRRVRPPLPGCRLALPSDVNMCEVQVRQQNDEDEFLLEAEDTIPVTTTVTDHNLNNKQHRANITTNSKSNDTKEQGKVNANATKSLKPTKPA